MHFNLPSERKAALFVSNWFSISGQKYSGYTLQLVSKLQKQGWQITTTSPRSHRVIRALDMCCIAWRTRERYAVAQIDVFSGAAFLWAEAVSLVLRHFEKPFVLTLHGGNLPNFTRRWPSRVRQLLNSAAAVTTPSIYLQSALSNIRRDIILLPYGFDRSNYPFQHRLQPAPQIAWLRAFHTIYSPITAVKALSLLVNEFPEMELTMFGPDRGDGSFQKMQDWTQQAGVASRVHIPGPVPKAKVPSALASYDIFLNTTTAESFGVSVMEAAALGMCIVTTNVGELPYIWTDKHDALLVPPNDPEAMAHAIRRILTEPGLAERLSRNARAKAELFDWSVVLPQWETLLTSVIEQHKI